MKKHVLYIYIYKADWKNFKKAFLTQNYIVKP